MKSLFGRAARIARETFDPTWIKLERAELMAFVGDADDTLRDPVHVATDAIKRLTFAMQVHYKKQRQEREAHPYLKALNAFREEIERPHYFIKEDITAIAVQEKTLQKLAMHSHGTGIMILNILDKHHHDLPYSPQLLEIIHLHDAVAALARKHKIGRYADGMADDVQCYVYTDIPRQAKKHPEDLGLNPASATMKWPEYTRFPGNRYEPSV